MSVLVTGTGTPLEQGDAHIIQNGRDPLTGLDGAIVHARKDTDQDADTAGKDVEEMFLPLKNIASYRFEWDFMVKTQQVLTVIGAVQMSLAFTGQLESIHYASLQVVNGSQILSESAQALGTWLGHATLGPGPAWRYFRLVGGLRTTQGGYLKARFRSVGVLGLGNPTATVAANSTAVAREC